MRTNTLYFSKKFYYRVPIMIIYQQNTLKTTTPTQKNQLKIQNKQGTDLHKW